MIPSVLLSREQEKKRVIVERGRREERHNNTCFVARFGITRETGYEIVVCPSDSKGSLIREG